MTILRYRASIAYITIVLLALTWGAVNLAIADDVLPTEKECNQLENPNAALKGWCIVIDREKGNCLACHQIVTDKWPMSLPQGGVIGPPLISMKHRYPDKDKLRAQIWNAQSGNPHSMMPPFGKYKLISEQDIDNIVEFLLTI